MLLGEIMVINFSQYEENEIFASDIEQVFKTALDIVEVDQNIAINIIDVSPSTIQELNKDYRNVDRVTDVLSFPMLDSINDLKNEPDYALGECNIGDIYINPQRAQEQAKEYGHSYRREYCFLALHGLLHLLGFDHIKPEEEKVMFNLQDKILQIVNIGRDNNGI